VGATTISIRAPSIMRLFATIAKNSTHQTVSSVIKLNVIMLNVAAFIVILSIMAPLRETE
jgi:hypothetical protein